MTLVNTIHLGDHYVKVEENKEGNRVAVLGSGLSGKVLEVESVQGNIRIKEMELGSAIVSPEHLAILLNESGLSDAVIEQINALKKPVK